MKKFLIAEVGNNHMGDFTLAKQMIISARDNGANLVKFQAFEAKDINGGSMPKEFYERVQFSVKQFEELIQYGRTNGIEVFATIFSQSYAPLIFTQRYHKTSGSQSDEQLSNDRLIDMQNGFVSFKEGNIFAATRLRNAIPLYVMDYMKQEPRLMNLAYLASVARGAYGFSDHYVGTDASRIAINHMGATVIEKHFTLQKNMTFRGQVFRDTCHGATPAELEQIANWLFS